MCWCSGGFINMAELEPMKYKEAMNQLDVNNWKVAVLEEEKKINDYKVFQEVPRSSIQDKGKSPIINMGHEKT